MHSEDVKRETSNTDLIEEAVEALRKIMPIRVHDGADYAEVYFADGVTHSTQAMTMNPQDWLDIAAVLAKLTATMEGSHDLQR